MKRGLLALLRKVGYGSAGLSKKRSGSGTSRRGRNHSRFGDQCRPNVSASLELRNGRGHRSRRVVSLPRFGCKELPIWRQFLAVKLAALTAASIGCVGTTGGDLITFHAAASGPADVSGGRLSFVSGSGYRVTLTRARFHVGAIYLNETVPISGSQETSCILPGVYVAQVTRGIDVDALSSSPQPFPETGEGIANRATAGEVWLTGGDVNALDDSTVVLDLEGTAEGGGATYPFSGRISIGKNRDDGARDPARPGASPICKQRIVSPIPADLRPEASGSLLLRIDPRGLFNTVDFSTLKAGSGGRYVFDDGSATQASLALYTALRSRQGIYSFSWTKE
jgi:hypothetical protein